jgi:hypothetical protein
MRICNPERKYTDSNQALKTSFADPDLGSESGMNNPDHISESLAVLRTWDVYSGSRIRLFSIPDPNFFHSGSQIHIKELKYFTLKNSFLKLSEI